MGMELEEWKNKSCVAHFGVGDDWATLYDIQSGVQKQGHATELLEQAKHFYQEIEGKKFGGTVALNDTMKRLYKKIGIEECV